MEKMGAELKDKPGGRGWIKVLHSHLQSTPTSTSPSPALSPPEPQQCIVRVAVVPEVEVHQRRLSAGEAPREAQFGVRALFEDRRTRHSWQSPAP